MHRFGVNEGKSTGQIASQASLKNWCVLFVWWMCIFIPFIEGHI